VLDPRLGPLEAARQRYWDCLRSLDAQHAAEMLFRKADRIVAGLSLVWTGSAGRRPEQAAGEAVQAYVEFALAARLDLPRLGPAGVEMGRLTGREQQIVELACHGYTNAQIAAALGIGLATVKTHLIHVFGKVGVHTRSALVGRLLSQGAARRPAGDGRSGAPRTRGEPAGDAPLAKAAESA
jgi:DNA-binding NarL/FixJ family response regulator